MVRPPVFWRDSVGAAVEDTQGAGPLSVLLWTFLTVPRWHEYHPQTHPRPTPAS